RFSRDWSSDVCSSDLGGPTGIRFGHVTITATTDRLAGAKQHRMDHDRQLSHCDGRVRVVDQDGVALARNRPHDAVEYRLEVGPRSEERRVGKEGRCRM